MRVRVRVRLGLGLRLRVGLRLGLGRFGVGVRVRIKLRVKGLHDGPRDAGARDPALQHQVRRGAPVAEGDGAHVPG